MNEEYSSGYIQRTPEGRYEGSVKIEGNIDLSPIEGVYFKEDGESYLWLKRKPVLEYDEEKQEYRKRERLPKWECYLKKLVGNDAVEYKGEFIFMHFRFTITGVWDNVFGKDKKLRLNLFVERSPMSQQTIINSINERKRNERRTGIK